MKLLYVEDSAVSQQVVADQCERRGWECDIVNNHEDGRELLRSNHYDAAVLDPGTSDSTPGTNFAVARGSALIAKERGVPRCFYSANEDCREHKNDTPWFVKNGGVKELFEWLEKLCLNV